MKFRRVGGVVVFFIVVAGILATLFGRSLSSSGAGAQYSQVSIDQGNIIVRENAQPGTYSWRIPSIKAASTQIQAYADATSVQPGQKLTFYVSTQKEGSSYSINIYRLGWYGGDGGRLIASQGRLVGHAQGYYDSDNRRLVDCSSCHVDTTTGLVEANWQPSYTLAVPSNWITGVYLAKFTDVHGMQTYARFDVRGNALSRYVAVTSDTTDEAYNRWGGYSLYETDQSVQIATSELQIDERSSQARGVKVSFDRPYLNANGSGDVLTSEVDSIHWLERQGYDLSYISSVDLHEDPKQLLHHRAYLSLGHDEYWTKEMRDGVERARNNGVGLAFLGADASYWQIRFEPDGAGTPNRTIVCYKVETANHDLARDPLYGKDNTRLTAQWRDPVLARPENALVGIMYADLTHQRLGFPWQVSSKVKSPLLDGTGLLPGQRYGCDLVGYEWDRVFMNGATPAGLQVIGFSRTRTNDNEPDFSDTTYYIAPSGAMVFATGSIFWALSLDNYRSLGDNVCAGQSSVVPEMQKLMARVIDALVIHHPLRPQS